MRLGTRGAVVTQAASPPQWGSAALRALMLSVPCGSLRAHRCQMLLLREVGIRHSVPCPGHLPSLHHTNELVLGQAKGAKSCQSLTPLELLRP